MVMGWTGVLGLKGEILEHPAIESLIGARLIRRLESRDNHVSLSAGPNESEESVLIRGHLDPDWPFLVEGPAVVYEPTSAVPIGTLHRPHRTVRQLQGKEGTDWPMSAGSGVGPALLLNKVGKGRVLTIAASPDVATAGEHRIVEARKLLSQAVRALHPSPRLRIEAPAFVESVVTRDPASRQYRVHLIAYAPTPTTTPPKNRPYVIPGLIENAPIYQARIDLAENPRHVRAWNQDSQVKVSGKVIEILVRDIHDVVMIDY